MMVVFKVCDARRREQDAIACADEAQREVGGQAAHCEGAVTHLALRLSCAGLLRPSDRHSAHDLLDERAQSLVALCALEHRPARSALSFRAPFIHTTSHISTGTRLPTFGTTATIDV